MGKLADWEEDPAETKDTERRQAINRYQEFRALIECQSHRPIPWVFEAPYICKNTSKPFRSRATLRKAKVIRTKVRKVIEKLNELLKKENLSLAQYQRCLIACLYWFVLVPEDGIGEPIDDEGKPQLVVFLKRQHIKEGIINEIRDKFSEYLQNSGGGLGLFSIGDDNDAKFEATALDTASVKMGLCTEQSKVMYAVLRMAGIGAFFVEPRLSVEYRLATAKPEEKEKNKQLRDKPIRSHMASGVGIKVKDENGSESVWIIDAALKLLEADYVREKTGQWKIHPYWELSLRHFYMTDLSNLGEDQINHGRYTAARQNFDMALELGEDSTSFHAMGNYAHLLDIRMEQLSKRSRQSKDDEDLRERLDEDIDKYSKEAVKLNPSNPVFQYNRGQYLVNKKNWENWDEMITSFLKSIDADPRFVKPYQTLGMAIYNIREKFPNDRPKTWERFKEQMDEIALRHDKLKEVIKKGLKEMQKVIPSKKPLGKELICLIEQLKGDLKL